MPEPPTQPRSLGFRTDLMLLGLSGAKIGRAGALTVVRTPSNPGYWWGNFVLAPGPAALPEAHARFPQLVPGAGHVAIGIDGTDGAPGIDEAAAALGLETERATVLTATALRPPAHPNGVAEFRRLASDADFAGSVDLHCANHPDDGRAFHAARVAAWRRLQEAGHGAWFGAFVGGTLRAGLGVFTDGRGDARFQAVDTHPAYRERGLAGTLVHHAGTEALGWPGVGRLVIVADPDDAAIRIYRRLGLEDTETQVQLIRPPEGPA